MRRAIRLSILLLGALAAVLALRVQSVQRLWFFTSDLVFVLLFPQLVYALYDPRANRAGSIAAFAVSLILRLGGGEPILAIPSFIPYAEIFEALLPPDTGTWFDASGSALFPVRTFAAAAGLVLMPVVSRLTARWDPPRAIPQPSHET
jgi:high affinity choline transporter 7